MNRIIQPVANWVAVLLWLGVIYYFSNQPDLKSALAPLTDLLLRKTAHMAEYFVLTYLIFRALMGHTVRWSVAVVFATLAAIGYAVTDEWHQGFVAGRSSSLVDVGIDSTGALLMSALLLWEKRRKSVSL